MRGSQIQNAQISIRSSEKQILRGQTPAPSICGDSPPFHRYRKSAPCLTGKPVFHLVFPLSISVYLPVKLHVEVPYQRGQQIAHFYQCQRSPGAILLPNRERYECMA